MNIRSKIVVLLVTLLVTACNTTVAPPTPTATLSPAPTSTPTSTPTNIPTSTPTPIPILTLSSEIKQGIAPRWMILAQPGTNVEILGQEWKYAGDNWGPEHACIDYVPVSGDSSTLLEQCFAMSREDRNFSTVLEPFITRGFENLQPKTEFAGVEQISLVAKAEEENNKHFFEILQSQGYILLVEMNYTTDDNGTLQEIYEKNLADIIDYVLTDSLQKAHLVAPPTPTPVPQARQQYYNAMEPRLITLTEANSIYSGNWDVLGDEVFKQRRQVCRDFEDRTNADVRWVYFFNCVIDIRDVQFEEIGEYYQDESNVLLESSYTYEYPFVLYAYQVGHTYFDGFLQAGDYIYWVGLESRTLSGEGPEDVFSQAVDDFIHDVLMENIEQ